jgi:DNA repair ATPase RecN
MDENKVFDLLEKIYIEVQETKSEVKSHTERFNNVESRLDTIENQVKKLSVKIDAELIPTDKAILDGYKDNAEHIEIIDDKIDRLQIDVNSISMKVSYNDSRIIEISKDLKKAK